MTKKKCPHIEKLSVSISLSSRSKTSCRLAALELLIKNSNEISENMTTVVGHFRQAGITAQTHIAHKLIDNEVYLKNAFHNCSDFVMRKIKITNNPNYSATLAYIDGMVKQDLIEESVIKKLTAKPADNTYHPNSEDYIQYLLGIRPEDIHDDLSKVVESILNSKLILFVDGVNKGLTIDFKNPPARNVEQPEAELSLRGPKEGFTESIRTNTCLLRRKIKNINLKMESHTLGKQTKTDLVVCYLSGIANDKIVNEVRARLHKIKIDSVLGSNYIEEYIQDSPYFIFPTIFHTEKPDVVASKILEGHVAILVDGTPDVLTVPCLFVEFMKTLDDYYLKFIPATLNRWVRYLSFFFSVTFTGFYVALLTFHQELIPDALIITIIKSRAGVPFPLMWECLAMLFTYEVLREAGIRMPKMIGPAVSIAGALVIGQAGVEAGLVSTLTVVVVGFTAITSLTIPSPEMSVSQIFPRFFLLLLSGTLGMLGLAGGIMILFINMISARSFGVPYMSPLAPLTPEELPDVVIRAPLWTMIKRSKIITWKQSQRRKTKLP